MNIPMIIYIPIQSLKQQQAINGATLTIDDTHEANEATTAVASPIHRRTIFPFRFFFPLRQCGHAFDLPAYTYDTLSVCDIMINC